ncbi:MAG: biotin--[acetyl-CoA-carboxylase] ligase [Lautropia sp.]|nr:biotin--[acetyl-CoA-carboxylase] ligase [Lautropia sp.]
MQNENHAAWVCQMGRLRVEWVESIDSTNLELMRRTALMPADETADAVWLIAGEQTDGRGRRGKRWASVAGGAVIASLGRDLPAVHSASMAAVPLVTGIVIAEYLSAQGLPVGIKWPNDLCVLTPDVERPFAKVGGILCEMRSHASGARLVIGCGLNVRAFPGEVLAEQPVASLYDGRGPADLQGMSLAIGEAVFHGSEQLLTEGFEAFADRWQAFDLLAGRPIRIHQAQAHRDAMALGIDEQGALRVCFDDDPSRIVSLMAEQISVRPLV